MKIINTFVFPIIRTDNIIAALQTLKKNTPPNFRTIVVNQTVPNQQFEKELYDNCDYIIRPHFNLGFAGASNLGIRLAPTPYITICNDDVEFTWNGWWSGILETFERFETAAAVNPQSIKEPGWGWGQPGYRHLIPKAHLDAKLNRLKQTNDQAMARLQETEKCWQEFQKSPNQLPEERQRLLAKLNESKAAFSLCQEAIEHATYKASHDSSYIKALIEEKNWQVVDAFACWCTVFRADKLEELGLFDERFVPGGGEDYDMMYRIYHKGYRALSSSRSFVWHWWSQSKGRQDGYNTALPLGRPRWNKLSTKGFGKDGLYDPDLDCWAKTGVRTDPNIYRAPL